MNLDPSPRNELGKNILDPSVEAELLAEGYTYARRVYHADGNYHLRLAKAPIRLIAAEIFLSGNHLVNNTILISRQNEK